jgi:DNA-binding transcriptional regulator GbsR (MarR family)
VPGGRLTYQDRQDIATGLAKGLTYAEIARRLARPTSTITREVTRNGGPGDYRPGQAQQATQRRARRRKPTLSRPAPMSSTAYDRDPQAAHDFEEQFTALLVTTGLPRMTARMLACLYTTDSDSLTAAELVQRLQVSPASVSTAIRYLEVQGQVRRGRDAGGRRDRYFIDDDVWYRSWSARAQMNATLADTILQGAEIFGTDTPAGARLQAASRFFRQISRDMIQAAERWRQVFSTQHTTDARSGDGPPQSRSDPGDHPRHV